MALAVVGVVASIIQLIDPVLKTWGYIRDLKNASEEQRMLLSEMEALSSLLQEIQSRVPNNPASSTQERRRTLKEFETTIKNFTKLLPKPGESKFSDVSKHILWPLGKKKEAKDYLEKFERHKSFLNTWLLIDLSDAGGQHGRNHDAILRSVENAAGQQRLSADRQQQAHDRILQTIQENTREYRIQVDDEKHNKILEWFSPMPLFQRHQEISGARQPGTGGWLLEDIRFKHWRDSSGAILLCHGMPGAGKTVLASLIVDHLEAEFRNDKTNVVLHIYLDHKKTEIQTPSNILAGLCGQLVSENPIPPLVLEVFERHNRKRTRPLLAELKHVLCSIVGHWSRIFVVVDALDEYPEDDRQVLLRHIAAMGPNVNLMATSRPHIIFDVAPRDYVALEIRATPEDIQKYVDGRIKDSVRLSRLIKTNPGLREEIENRISSLVDGMFLLARLHITSLADYATVKELRQALGKLPKDLERTYDEAMDRIDQQGEEDRKLAYLALTWVANAKRVLNVAELQEALAIEPDTTRLDPENLAEMDIIASVCAGLVIVDERSSSVRLVHHTTQHYLDSVQDRRFPNAHTDMTHKMLILLAFEDIANISNFNYLVKPMAHPGEALLKYCPYTLLHAVGQPEERLRDMIMIFLRQATRWRNLWQRERVPPWNFDDWPRLPSLLWIAAASNLQHIATHLLETNRGNDRPASALHTASYYGHIDMVKLLLDHGFDVNAQSGVYGSALQAAAYGGHENLVRLLLDRGADIDAQSGKYNNALHAASHQGHKRIVFLLITMGINLDMRGNDRTTALQLACAEGHEEVACLLIENGADVNARGGPYGSALQAAAYQGYKDLVQRLVEKNAQVNVPGSQYGTTLLNGYVQLIDDSDNRVDAPEECRTEEHGPALQAASYNGHEGIVRLLIDKGACVNALGGKYGTALQVASYFGHRKVVELLIEKGAKDLRGGYFGTALQASSAAGYTGIMELLIRNGSNVNAQGGEYGTALQAASAAGHKNAAQLLIQWKADINVRGGQYGSALHAARENRRKGVVKLLVQEGADLNTRGGKQDSILQIASSDSNGSDREVCFLLDHTVDVNNQGGQYGTALQAASLFRRMLIIKLLIKHRADVNALGGKYGSALQAASYQGYKDVAQFLIDNYADVNLQGGKYGTALQAACAEGHREVVELLIKHDADVNLPGGEYGSPLQAALYHGHDSLVRFLIEKGAEVNGEHSITPLQRAACRANGAMVDLLLQNGAAINTIVEVGKYGTALEAASVEGSKAVVQRLIEGGADVNALGGEYGSAVQAASYRDRLDVVKLLIEKGAGDGAHCGKYGSALAAASYRGHQSIVEFLIANNADMGERSERYGRALQAASSQGHEGIVRLLLDAGAGVNTPGGEYGSALHAACCKGHGGVVRLLIGRGAEVDLLDGNHATPVQVASYQGHKTIVQLLIEKGANLNAQSKEYGSPLHAASCRNHVEVAQLLIENGARVNALSDKYGTALEAASFRRRKAVVQLLISSGADVNLSRGGHRGPIQAVEEGGYETLMNNVPHSEDVAEELRRASIRGYWAVVELLTKLGANFNFNNLDDRATIPLRLLYDYETIARLLVNNGAQRTTLTQ